jgi:NDP-sugar pyrophosphorylase family protein
VREVLRNEPFIVYSGDLLTDFQLDPVIDEHFRRGNDVTLALRETTLATDVALEGHQVVDIGNKYGRPGQYDFANISVWNPTIFERIPPGNVSLIPVVREWIGNGGKVGGVVVNDGKWFNIGSRTEYLQVHRIIYEDGWKPRYGADTNWPQQIAPDAIIDSTAEMSGFYSVGDACRVGAGAVLENTIVWPGAQIASRSHLRNCIVRSARTVEGSHRDTDI